MNHSVAILLAALLLGVAVAAAQTGGTGVIRGRVVAADTGQPVRGARITIFRDGGSQTVATADDRGVYEIRGLEAGIHVIRVFPPTYKAMYLSADRTASDELAYIEIDEAQTLENVDFALPRAGAISGRVVDEYGQPIAGMEVAALEVRVRRLLPAGVSGETDDEGRYRVWGLSPGRYYLRASGAKAEWTAESGPNGETYLRTFYPGTPSAAEALPIPLGESQVQSNVDIRAVWSRTFTVSGRATDRSGQPVAGATVRLATAVEGLPEPRQTASNVSGQFHFLEVVPGDYVLTASPTSDAGDATSLVARRTRLRVTSADVIELPVPLYPGLSVSGTVVTDSGATPPFDPQQTSLRVLAIDADGFAARAGTVRVRADWSFGVENVTAPITIRPVRLPEGWYLKSVRHRGADHGHAPIDFMEAGDPADLLVVFSDAAATLAGTVVDAAGRPALGSWVLLYPAGADPGDARLVERPLALADEDGRFEIKTVPPGDYLVAAFHTRDGRALEEEAAKLKEVGTPLTLGERERKEIRLRAVWPY